MSDKNLEGKMKIIHWNEDQNTEKESVNKEVKKEVEPSEFKGLDINGILETLTPEDLDPANNNGISMSSEFRLALMEECLLLMQEVPDSEKKRWQDLYNTLKQHNLE